MNILVVHNYYGSNVPSGENIAFEAEVKALRELGHKVTLYTKTNDVIYSSSIIKRIKFSFSWFWSQQSFNDVKQIIENEKIEILHVHNLFPLISPSILFAAKNIRKRVFTLHNYRLGCPAGIPMRDGKVCTKCIDSNNPLWLLRYRCYRNSFIASLWVLMAFIFHKFFSVWEKNVDVYIALTRFQADLLANNKLKKSKFRVKPNFFDRDVKIIPKSRRDHDVTFVGRLSSEKGLEFALDAFQSVELNDFNLTIVGDGPLKDLALKATHSKNVNYIGLLPNSEVVEIISRSKVVIIPSTWFEGFPMVLGECFATGTPVLVSNIGALDDIVTEFGSGLSFEIQNLEDFFMKLKTTMDNWNSFSSGSLEAYNSKYCKAVNMRTLEGIYNE